jgi:hypothetical protein
METAKCPTTDKWIKTIVYKYTMEFYSATKKNKLLSFPGIWMELKNITLSKVSQAQKAKKLYFLPHMQVIDLKQLQQYYGTWVALRRYCAWEGIGQGKETKNLNAVDVLPVWERI